MSDDVAQKWRHYKATRDHGVRNELIAHYQPLVVYVARRAVPNAPAYQDRGEFESFGYFGLIDAVEKFDPDRDIKFETYAIRRIHGSILDGLRRADPLTRSARKLVKAVEAAFDVLQSELARPPSVEELAGHLGVSGEQVRMAFASQKSMETSLDHGQGSGAAATDADEPLLVDSLTDTRHETPELSLELTELAELMAVRLAGLPEKDRVFAALYYGEQMSLTEIGSLLGISESRVGQIRLRVMRQLRGMTAANARYEL